MATSLTLAPGLITVERTFRVERETPVGGYSLRIHREKITSFNGVEVGRESLINAYNEPASKTLTRASTAIYLAACKIAQTPMDLIAAESTWYDSLVAEVRAETAVV